MVASGLPLMALGLVLFALAPIDGSYVVNVFPVMVLLGAGAGLSFPALVTIAMSGATPSDAGLASGLVNTGAQAGGALGLAVLATMSTTRTENALADGVSRAAALNSGYHLAYLIGAALVVAAIAAALFVVQPPEQAAAQGASGEDGSARAESGSREPAYSEVA